MISMVEAKGFHKEGTGLHWELNKIYDVCRWVVREEMWEILKTGADLLVQPSPGLTCQRLQLGLGLGVGSELGVGVRLTLILTLNQIIVVILTLTFRIILNLW